MHDVQVIEPTPFQARVMAVPDMVDLFWEADAAAASPTTSAC